MSLVADPMFATYCPIVDDAWWMYYHHPNYALWQERADRLYAIYAQERKRAEQMLREEQTREERRKLRSEYERQRRRNKKLQQQGAAAAAEELQEQLAFVDTLWADGL